MNLKNKLVFALMLCASAVFAQVEESSTDFGEGIAYDYDYYSNGEEAGGVYFKLDASTLQATVVAGPFQYRGDVVIPATVTVDGKTYAVTTIGKMAFCNCLELNSVKLGDNVETIKTQAFYIADNATSGSARPFFMDLDAPKLKTLESNCFYSTYVIGNTDINGNAVTSNTATNSVIKIGKNVQTIGSGIWQWGGGNYAQKFVVDPENQYYCTDEYGILYSKDKKTLVIAPRYLKLAMGNPTTFEYNIPETVTLVHSFAFYFVSTNNWLSLTGLDGISSITSCTVGSAIKSLNIGRNVKTVNIGGIMYSGYTDYTVSEGSPYFTVIDHVLYKLNSSGQPSELVHVSRASRSDTVRLPATVTSIGTYAFYSNQYVKGIDCSKATNLTSIAETAAHGAKFEIEYSNLPPGDNSPIYVDQYGIQYSKDRKKMLLWSSNVKADTVILPVELTTISVSALRENNYIQHIVMGKNVSSIADQTFNHRFANLKSFSVDPNNKNFKNDESGALYSKDGKKLRCFPRGNDSLTYKVLQGTTELPRYKVFSGNKNLQIIDLGNTMTKVDEQTITDIPNLSLIRVGTKNPPHAYLSSFSSNMYGRVRLYVPKEFERYYETASIWNKFVIIKDLAEYEKDVETLEIEVPVEIYEENIDDNDYTFASTKNGYKVVFREWTNYDMETYKEGFTIKRPIQQKQINRGGQAISIYAIRNRYNVSWKVGDTEVSSASLKYGAQIYPPVDPAAPVDYKFIGWSTNASATSAINFSDVYTVPANNITFYAIFVKKDAANYTVNHYKQDLGAKTYTLVSTQTGSDIQDRNTNAVAESYEGFTVVPFSQKVIAGDGSTVVNIYYNRNSYSLGWNFADGTPSDQNYTKSGSVQYGAVLVAPTLLRTGYDMAWETTIPSTMPAQDVTYTAVWTAKEYPIKWMMNDGTDVVYSSGNVNYGTDIVAPAVNPSRVGYTFEGWSDSENGAVIANLGKMNTTSQVTYYAVWTIKQYTATWHLNNGSGTDQTTTITYGQPISPIANPTAPADYDFVGWNTNASATSAITFDNNYTAPASNVDFYAIYAMKGAAQYTVNHYKQDLGATTYTLANSQTGSDIQDRLTNAVAESYEGFAVQPFDQKTITADGKTVVDIYYNRISYNLTWDFAGGTSTNNNYTQAGAVQYGATIVAPTLSRTGYEMSWATPIASTMPAENVTYTASWNANSYTISWLMNDGTNDAFTSTSVKFDNDITAPATTPTRTGYNFNGWASSSNGAVISNFGKLATTNAVSYYAVWSAKQFTATWHKNDGSNATSTTSIVFGQTVEPIANPTAPTDYRFVGWGTSADATIAINFNNYTASTDVDFYAIYAMKDAAQYTVNHYQQDLGKTTYTLHRTQTGSDIQDRLTNAVAESYDGFAVQPFSQKTIAGDGSTVVDIYYNRISYNLAWEFAGGTPTNNKYTQAGSIQYGAVITAPTLKRTGYSMVWNNPIAATMPAADVTYTAEWSANEYSVKWMMNDGTNDVHTTSYVLFNDNIVVPSGIPSRDGYTHAGWSDSKTGTALADFGKLTTAADKSFYAVWAPNQYTATWHLNNGSDETQTSTIVYGQPISPIANPAAPTDYVFVGWNTTASATTAITFNESYVAPASNVDFYAVYAMKGSAQYTINHYKQDLGADTYTLVSTEKGSDIQDRLTSAQAESFEGFAAQDFDQQLIAGDGTTVVNIYYNRINYSLTWDFANGTPVDDNYTKSGNVQYGAAIVAPTLNRVGYSMEWDSPIAETMPSSDVYYTAQWAANNYSVDWMYNDGTSQLFTTTNVDFDENIVAPTEQPSRLGYTFAGWSNTQDGEAVTDFGKLTTTNQVSFYATWTANSYTATWFNNDGTDDQTTTQVEFGQSIVEVASPSREGYTFAGWGDAANAETAISDFGTMTVDGAEFFALWTANNYEANWYNNDGTDNKTTTQVAYGQPIEPIADLEREGFAFIGWGHELTSVSSTIVTDFGTMTTNGADFYAVWEKNIYTISWFINDAAGSMVESKASFNDEIVAPITPMITGFAFNGWSKSVSGTVVDLSQERMPSHNVSYYASWTPGNYTINWYNNDGTDDVLITEFEFGQQIIAPESPTRKGYLFAGWGTSADAVEPLADLGTVTVNGADFYAIWTANSFAAVWNLNNGTDSCIVNTVNFGDIIVAPANPIRTGYNFVGWGISADASEPLANFGTMTINGATFYGIWTKNSYNVEWMFNDGTDNKLQTAVAFGDKIIAPANPSRDNYVFAGWSNSANGNVITDFGTMQADHLTFYAKWTFANTDFDDDGICDLNCDIDGDGIPDLNIDTDGDGKADKNIVDIKELLTFDVVDYFTTCEFEDDIELTPISDSKYMNYVDYTFSIGDANCSANGTSISLPSDANINDTVTITSQIGTSHLSKQVAYSIKQRIIATMWDDVVSVINTNHQFNSYVWMHNGKEVGTKPFYQEVGGITGQYSLVATKTDGSVVYSCDENFGSAQQLVAYPNPVVDVVTIAGGTWHSDQIIKVYSASGELVLEQQATDGEEQKIDLSSLPQGSYLIMIGNKSVNVVKQ